MQRQGNRTKGKGHRGKGAGRKNGKNATGHVWHEEPGYPPYTCHSYWMGGHTAAQFGKDDGKGRGKRRGYGVDEVSADDAEVDVAGPSCAREASGDIVAPASDLGASALQTGKSPHPRGARSRACVAAEGALAPGEARLSGAHPARLIDAGAPRPRATLRSWRSRRRNTGSTDGSGGCRVTTWSAGTC